MELTFLGTASAIPTRYRNHTAILVKVSNRMILLDCGEATQKQLMKAEISPMKIDDIYITHLHGDHILGLPGLIQSLAFRGRTRPLNIYGPKGIGELIDHIKHLGYCTMGYDLITHEILDDDIIIYQQNDFLVKARKMKHTVFDYAYKIEELRQPKFLRSKAIELGVPPGPLFGKLQAGNSVSIDGKVIEPEEVLGPPRKGVKFVFSGDTIPQESMIDFAKDVDLLIHEATFTGDIREKATENGHTVAEDAARIAKDANVEQLILTHLSNRYTDSKPLVDEARQVFKNTVYAKDLMTVVIENKKPVTIKKNK
ncbi:ribonuclease Z [Methanosphaera sp. WGK6]|uniref:ribonuclease Z n=1 Tax=Methanosphaera sp. WGK6 TaxID=1561964 RepID=UPI00084C02FC|nr:ribonuclease Z [Methanosphaera sp. WGK6]OED30047.1 ribonuclease Z [Methanosphaera sp. WGK6]